MSTAHRGHIAPSGPRSHGPGSEFLAAPRAEDHIGRAPRHLQRIGDDAVLAERFTRELGEAVVATGDPDQFRHPANTGDLRLVPLFEIHAWTAREPRGALPDRLQACLELLHEVG